MGIKMKPITERVNAGLFNQKKADKFSNEGVREPLLNVGPAGVYGDNITKDSPSPAKKGYKMSSPFKKESAAQERKNLMDDMPVDEVASGAKKKSVTANSPLKKDPPVSAGDIVTGSVKNTVVDPIVTDGETVSQTPSTNRCGTQAEKDAGKVKQTCEESGYNAVLEKRKTDPCYNFKCPKDSSPKVVGDKCECKTAGTSACPEGSTKNADGQCVKSEGSLKGQKVRNQGEYVRPWESRMNERNRKFYSNRLNRSNKQVTNLKDKLASQFPGYGTEGFTAPKPGEKGYKRYENMKNKLTNALSGQSSRQQGLNNASRQIEQNLSGDGQGVSGIQLFESDEQDARTSQIDGRGGPNSITEDQIILKDKYGADDSPADKNVKKFFKKKSPMKLKYFK